MVSGEEGCTISEYEIERLVVRLVGDGSEYVKMLKEAQEASKQAVHAVEEHGKHIEGFKHKIEEYAEGVEKGLLRIGLVVGAWEAFEKADEAEKMVRHLSAAVELNGGVVSEVIEDYNKFAKTLSQTVEQSKGTILKLINMAESFGKTGDGAKKSAEEAIYLAAATGNSAEAMLKMSQAMSVGGEEGAAAAEMFKRMVPQLRGAANEMEFAEKYAKLVALGMKLAAGDTEDTTGKLDKLKQALGGLTKEIGQNLATVIEPVIELLSKVFKIVSGGNETVRGLIITVLTLAASVPLLTSAYGYLVAAKVAVFAHTVALTSAIWAQIPAHLALRAALAVEEFRQLGVLAAGARAGLVGLAAVGIVVVVTAIAGLKGAYEELDEAIKQSGKSTEKMIALTGKIFKSGMEEIGKGTHTEQLADLEAEKKRIENEIRGNDQVLKSAKKAQEEMSSSHYNPLEWVGKQLFGGGEREATKSGTEDAQKFLDANKERLAQIRDEEKKVREMGIKEADKYIEQLNLEATLTGKSADEQERYKLALHGVTDAKMEEVITTQEALRISKEEVKAAEEAAAAHKKLEDSVNEITNALLTEINTMGMSADEIQLYKLRLAGADEGTIDFVRSLQEQRAEQEAMMAGVDDVTDSVKGFREEVQKLDGVLSGSAEALARTSAFRESLRTVGAGTDGVGLKEGNLRASPVPQTVASSSRSDSGRDKMVTLLTDIRTTLNKIETKPAAVLVGEDGE